MQIDDKGRALVKLAFHANRSTLCLDELAGDRQSQAADGLAALVAAREAVEDIWQIFNQDTLNLLRGILSRVEFACCPVVLSMPPNCGEIMNRVRKCCEKHLGRGPL